MTKIYETPINGYNENGEILHIYQFDDDTEFMEWDEMSHDEKEETIGVKSEYGCVMPGARFTTYSFIVTEFHLIIQENISYNV